MTTETRAAFARRIGWHKSSVTRAVQDGRVVLTADGKRVDVEASLVRIEATRGTRHDVADRHAAGRAQGHPDTASAIIRLSWDHDAGLDTDEIGRRTRLAQMRKEEAEAERRALELRELTSALVRRDEVERALAGAVAEILGQLENAPDRIAPQVHGIQDMAQVRARIKDEIDHLCRAVAEALGRLADADREEAA